MDCKIRNTIQCEDFIVISEDETPIPKKKRKIKSKNMKCERKVTLRAVEKNTEKLVITQEVQVKKQKIKCVINLNTNVYENKTNTCMEEQQKPNLIVPKANCSSISSTERIVPTCGRKICKTGVKIKKKTKIKDKTKTKRSSRNTQKYSCKKRKKSKRKHHSAPKRSKHSRLPRDRKPSETFSLSLSSISLSPLKSNEISYEDISLDSFTNCSEEDLDTLIQRTKERDRQHSCNGQLLHCSTPNNIIDISSDDDVLVIDQKSTENTSIYSTETLILDPQTNNSAATSSLFSKQNEYTDKNCKNILTKKTKYDVEYDQKVASNFLFSEVQKNIQSYYYDENINNNLKDVKNENIANIFCCKNIKSEADNGLEIKATKYLNHHHHYV